jgi:hypothetical protein
MSTFKGLLKLNGKEWFYFFKQVYAISFYSLIYTIGHLEDLLILAQNISKSWREFYKHKQMYGKGDMTAFPNLKFERSPIWTHEEIV